MNLLILLRTGNIGRRQGGTLTTGFKLKKTFIAVMAGALAALPGLALADPPGNNGTVKIDGVEFDTHPNNQPHVGCIFQVDFYGYDEGDLDADYTFRLVPPTADGSTGEASSSARTLTVGVRTSTPR